MACRPQGNPRSSSSDGVPPELEILGLRVFLPSTGLTGWSGRSDRSPNVLTRLASTYFLATLLGRKKQSTSVLMAGEKGDASKVDPANTINISYEDLSKEQR